MVHSTGNLSSIINLWSYFAMGAIEVGGTIAVVDASLVHMITTAIVLAWVVA